MARPEVTGKKSATNEPPVKPPRMALSIPEFSEANGFSPSMYYKMKRQGETPREMKVGTRTLITVEAAAEWRAQREAAAAAAAARVKAKAAAKINPSGANCTTNQASPGNAPSLHGITDDANTSLSSSPSRRPFRTGIAGA